MPSTSTSATFGRATPATAATAAPDRPRTGPVRLAVAGLGLGLSLAAWVRVTVGAIAVRRLIADHTAANGPIDLSEGVVQHDTPALVALCDDLIEAGGFFYPFGWLVLIAPAAAWAGFSALAAVDRRPGLVRWSIGVAVAISLILLVLFAVPVHQMTIITE